MSLDMEFDVAIQTIDDLLRPKSKLLLFDAIKTPFWK